MAIKTKVIRITTRLNFGGVERDFELHAKFHNQSDYELIIVALENGGRAEEFIKRCGIRVIILNLKSSRIPSLAAIRKLMRLIREEKPQVIHTSCAEGNFHGLIAGWLTGVRVRVGEEIGIPSHSRLARFVFRLVYGTAHSVIGISKAVASYLTTHEVSARKIEMVYYPIDTTAVTPPRKKSGGPIVFATVCRLEEVKNLPILLSLLHEIRKRHPEKSFNLWLLGDGSLRDDLVRRTEELGLTDAVKFYGYVDNPQQIIVDADAFFLPSWTEGFGLACIEAIQCNLPVLVSRSGGMMEYITDGVNGYLFDPASLDELLAKTESLLALTPDELLKLKERATATIYELFSPEKYLSELKRVYRIA